jgi:hypothetical protein
MEVAPVPEGGEHRILTAHRCLDGGDVKDVSLDDRQSRMVDLEPGRISNQRRDGVAALQGPRDELKAGTAGRAHNQDPRGRATSSPT